MSQQYTYFIFQPHHYLLILNSVDEQWMRLLDSSVPNRCDQDIGPEY